MKVKLSDLFFALYSNEFIDSLMEYLDKNYLPTSNLEVEISNGCLAIRDYDKEGVKISHKEVFITDIL